MKFEIVTITTGWNKPEHTVSVTHDGHVLVQASGVQSRETGEPSARSLAEELIKYLESEINRLKDHLKEIK